MVHVLYQYLSSYHKQHTFPMATPIGGCNLSKTYDNNIICYMTTYNIELRNGKVVKLEDGKVVNDK